MDLAPKSRKEKDLGLRLIFFFQLKARGMVASEMDDEEEEEEDEEDEPDEDDDGDDDDDGDEVDDFAE